VDLDANQGAFAYVLPAATSVRAVDTLRLGPGALVKGQPGSSLQVQGVLLAAGSEAQPVRLTSIRDDEWGGDTNGDGAATSPAPGDWGGLWLYGYSSSKGAADLEHAGLRYAGSTPVNAGVLFYYSDWARLESCEIARCANAGMYVTGASAPVVSRTRIVDNLSWGVYVEQGLPVFGSLADPLSGGNLFDGNDGGNFQLRNNTAQTIEAVWNDWGAYDGASVDQRIFDDDEAAVGPVIFAPFVIADGAPWIAQIVANQEAGTVALFWTPVRDATGYAVYSADLDYDGFALDESGVFAGASWTAPLPAARRFYQVRAVLPE